jgi:molybdopterin/thiamine biosynthesis adenylyltransferase
MLAPWWKEFPERLRFELKQLEDAGIEYQLNEAALEAGRVELSVRTTVDAETVDLIVRFSDLYPYFRFEVFAAHLELPHHQNPFLKNLCFINGTTESWSPRDTLADFLRNRLPLVLQTGRSESPEQIATLEEHQGEPITSFYTYEKNSLLLVDSSWKIGPSVKTGELKIDLEQCTVPILRGAVHEIRDANGKVLARAENVYASFQGQTITGRWVRIPQPLRQQDPSRLLDHIYSHWPSLAKPIWQTVGDSQIDVVGVIFPEEVSWRRTADGWVFVVRIRRDLKGFSPGHHWITYLARAGRAGRVELSARTPELISLSDKRIAVVGLGCIGAPSAIEFARAGIGKLHLMDPDIVEPGTVVRWPLGLMAAGTSKAETLATFIRTNYPYTEASCWPHRLGDALGTQKSDLNVLEDFLSGVDLIYDATAEVGVQYLLSTLAARRSLPYVCISASPGAWGGRVARIVPSRSQGCWMCLQHSIDGGIIPVPPSKPDDVVQPTGCTFQTFTGANFDLLEVSLTGVRVAIATLLSGVEGGYPDLEWDVGVLSLRTGEGRPICPDWKTYKLEPHPSCELCQNRSALLG